MKSYLSKLSLLSTLGAAFSAGVLASPASSPAADWPHWRGPHFNGSSDAKDLPEKFGKDENVLWKATLPGPSNSTPIVFGDRVFVSALDSSKKILAICLDKKDGKVLWQKEVGIGFNTKGENNMATPSPVTDGKRVFFLYGTGDLAAFDFAGQPLWSRNLQKDYGQFNIMWIYGSSPTLYKGKLYIQVLHTERPYGDSGVPGVPRSDGAAKSYLLALDPATGKEIWKHVRPDEAEAESKESYGTPIPHKTASGREELLLVGGDAVTGHDPETGDELWRFTGWNPSKIGHWRLVPSITAGGGVIVACAPKNGPVMGCKEDGKGDISRSGKLWRTDEKVTSDVPVPLYYRDHFFVLDHPGKNLTKLEPKTGKVLWQTRLPGAKAVARSSPTGADGKIYCMNVDGAVWVVSAEDGKVLHQTSLEGAKNARGTIAVVDGMLFARVGENLFAFGKK
jgi:outer membrane protein assembly factor BamB